MRYLDLNFLSPNLSGIVAEWLKWTMSSRGSVGIEFHSILVNR